MFGPDGALAIDRGVLAAKADALERTIRKLAALRDGLRHAAACPAPNHLACPRFRRILATASGPASRKRTRPVSGQAA